MIYLKKLKILLGIILTGLIISGVFITPDKSAYINGEILTDILFIGLIAITYKMLKYREVENE